MPKVSLIRIVFPRKHILSLKLKCIFVSKLERENDLVSKMENRSSSTEISEKNKGKIYGREPRTCKHKANNYVDIYYDFCPIFNFFHSLEFTA